ncbi:MAG: response regulator transcription factor [Paludibacter sp.]|nr:response regulator transcription factor [Paludibacter sp.]
MINIFIVDDHEIVREGFKKLIREFSDINITGEAKSSEEVLDAMESIACDIMLVDLYLPGKNGYQLLVELQKQRPEVKVIIMSINPEERSALRAYKLGASGYLCKDSSINEIINAIRKTYDVGRYISPEYAELLAFKTIYSEQDELQKLSDLETNILIMLYKGLEIKDIAKKTGLSIVSVFTYRKKIFENLKLNNNLDMIHYVKENIIMG